jgi:cyclopropane fatty-acyl-phospholipid synthase-like methyltransferase
MSSIWEPKDDYDTVSDFVERTQRCITGKDHATFSADAAPAMLHEPAVEWIKTQLNNIKEELGRELNILEVGSGYGRWPVVLEGFFETYTGVDVTESRVKHATKHYSKENVSFNHIKPCDWSMDKKYDVVFSLMVLQHLKMQDALDTFVEIENHLKEDGVAVLHEGRIGRITEAEANDLYLSDDCPAHMIYKPISLFEGVAPLEWHQEDENKKFPCQFILRRKNETAN